MRGETRARLVMSALAAAALLGIGSIVYENGRHSRQGEITKLEANVKELQGKACKAYDYSLQNGNPFQLESYMAPGEPINIAFIERGEEYERGFTALECKPEELYKRGK